MVERARRGKWVLAATWAYALVVIGALALIHGIGDPWWGVPVLLMMPRWLFLGPVLALALLSGIRRCPGHWLTQTAIVAAVAGPLMGFRAAPGQFWEQPSAGETVRIATLNLGLKPIREDALERWIVAQNIDLICFQEGGTESDPIRPKLPKGWQFSPKGQIATRWPVVVYPPLLAHDWAPGRLYTAHLEQARLKTPGGRAFNVASVHLPTIREGIEGLFQSGDTAGLTRQTAWWGHEMARVLGAVLASSDAPVLIAGDFNMPADDSTLAALRANFRFAFEEAGWGYGYTRPARYPWVKIDHILTGPQWRVRACRVGPDVGSDHLPVLAELVLPGR